MEKLKEAYDLDVKWIAFPLHPETPEEGMTLDELFAGRDVDIPAVMKRLKSAAAGCGLPFGERTMTYNSRLAQEAGKWAESRNRGEAFHMAVFKAYFVDGLNIAKVPALVDLAESIGLEGVEEILSNRIFKGTVDDDWEYSRACDIRAVPAFMVEGRRVVGAQPYDVLEKLIKGKP